jgi:hypothetical protein
MIVQYIIDKMLTVCTVGLLDCVRKLEISPLA